MESQPTIKSKKNSPARPVAPRKPAGSLKLSPAEAEREVGKLRELRDDLETAPSEADTSIRSSPLGRNP